MDRVLLAGIRCRMHVGCTAEERERPQDCLVDVELECDLTRAASTDDLNDSLDYARVFDLVQTLARSESFALLERFAGRLEEELRRAVRFRSVLIRVKKMHPPLSGALEYAGIEIRR
jgi:dihydroneopterin aldolase